MLFSELPFFIFFIGYFALHLVVPPRFRIWLIIVGSTVFYGWWRVDYVWLPFAMTAIAWTGVWFITRTSEPKQRKLRLIATICVLFAPLAIVKYAYFLTHDVLGMLPVSARVLGDVSFLKFALPLGISFVTFTLTAYVVDTYTGLYKGDSRFSTLLGYVLFFPHLIAGPILRPNELMSQLTAKRRALDARFALGIALFTLGLVKKLIFADTIGEVVDPVFRPGAVVSGGEYLLAIYGFSMQIYCDFSGYTDMAIGLAYLLRIRLPTNFNRPYISASPVEFWRRWHITLSHWLRDYLYIPLGGNRLGQARQVANLMITMVLGGLWHGANWSFLIWGFIHGVGLTASHLLKGPMKRAGVVMPHWLAVLLTFHFVTIAWIFFRAPDLAIVHQVVTGPFVAPWGNVGDFVSRNMFALLLLAIFLATHRYDRHARLRLMLRTANMGVVSAVLICMWILAITLRQGSSSKFIYFDF